MQEEEGGNTKRGRDTETIRGKAREKKGEGAEGKRTQTQHAPILFYKKRRKKDRLTTEADSLLERKGISRRLKRFQSPTDCTPAGSTSDRGKRGDQKEKGKEIQKVKRFTNKNKSEGRRTDIFSKESVLLKEKGNKYRFAKLKKRKPAIESTSSMAGNLIYSKTVQNSGNVEHIL